MARSITDSSGAVWEVAPSGRRTQYGADEVSLEFQRVSGGEPERRFVRFAPRGAKAVEMALEDISDRALLDVARNDPAGLDLARRRVTATRRDRPPLSFHRIRRRAAARRRRRRGGSPRAHGARTHRSRHDWRTRRGARGGPPSGCADRRRMRVLRRRPVGRDAPARLLHRTGRRGDRSVPDGGARRPLPPRARHGHAARRPGREDLVR